jgi:hypothetical protein
MAHDHFSFFKSIALDGPLSYMVNKPLVEAEKIEIPGKKVVQKIIKLFIDQYLFGNMAYSIGSEGKAIIKAAKDTLGLSSCQMRRAYLIPDF